ncbi:MAG TPA: bifunctional DNA-formamidopyrimidine glycosylase/DNA-(apurinic or apyrimidinic site) lyase [bacterium]|nr:bifunctional DNA-formamidopyrimidine glycosylase/DNA-(apurinic or apyrimidinic site) lyase [Candidatus Omnitrophota bacterium]HOL95215.1 bifunctional DNA-formamidopyrimidine glycosylase/DNA-(apurinic or apyrimidinic site) lyase [bacterium]HPP00970.1 bifunctional DNA-formamidopyrimidine glycosylase/DNA-(apurinic or apyrimidinic site) lyase [bacterium]
MPELPEVETIVRSLRKLTAGRRILKYHPLRNDYIHQGLEHRKKVTNSVIQEVERRGKYIAIHLSNNFSLLHHLGMSGRLLLQPGSDPLEKHTHLRILLDDGSVELRQRDPRRFGFAAILPSVELKTFVSWSHLGADPFRLRAPRFYALMAGRKQAVKSFLLDQRRIAGLGNIYTDEALFRAGIHPVRPTGQISSAEAGRLLQCIRTVLRESIVAGGSSTNDYQRLDGTLGLFQHKHRVYRRVGLPCPICHRKIEKLVLNGRSTHYCPGCQT